MDFNEDLTKLVMTQLTEFWEQEQLCDITLNVEDERIKSHKVWLAANSPFFKAMFCGNFPDSAENTIDMQGRE